MTKRGPELLRLWRESREMSQVELGLRLGLSVGKGVCQSQIGQKISRWETGDRRPSLDEALAIERVCKIAPRSWQVVDGWGL